jgi:hypothetical protein
MRVAGDKEVVSVSSPNDFLHGLPLEDVVGVFERQAAGAKAPPR